jgi:hypothetical protein
MRSNEIKQFIRRHASLFWYSPENKEDTVSDELLVETILNYGDMEAVKQLFRVMGIKKVSSCETFASRAVKYFLITKSAKRIRKERKVLLITTKEGRILK